MFGYIGTKEDAKKETITHQRKQISERVVQDELRDRIVQDPLFSHPGTRTFVTRVNDEWGAALHRHDLDSQE